MALAMLLPLIALFSASCGGVRKPEGWAPPALSQDAALIFTAKERLSAFDFAGPAPILKWTFPNKDLSTQKDIKLEAVYDSPLRTTDAVYLATYHGELFALNPADGSIIWRRSDIKAGIVGGPVLAQGKYLVFGTIEGRLYVVEAASGKPARMESDYQWPDNGVKVAGPVWAAPAIRGGGIYIATMTGDVVLYNIQGGPARKLYHGTGAIADLTLLDDAHLFVPSLNKTVTILNPDDGAVISSYRASDWVWSRPAFQSGIAYFGDFSGQVTALDITTGQAKWTAAAGARIKAAPAIAGGALVVADRKPAAHFFDLATGKLLNTVPILDAGTVRAAAVPSANVVYILTTHGRLFRANPADLSLVEVPLNGTKP